MGTIRITGPDGRVARITAQEGATEAQIAAKIAEVKANWPGAKPTQPDQSQGRSWADVPGEALRNAPRSAMEFGKAVAYPFTNTKEFATGVRDLAAGVGSKMVGGLDAASEYLGGPDLQTPEQKDYAERTINALGGVLKERYGGVENIKRTLATDPVGAAADVATAFYGSGATLPGRLGQAVKTAGSAVDPIRNVGRAADLAVKGVGKVSRGVLGVTTGTGPTPIRTAYEAGRRGNEAFRDHMRGMAPMEDVVEMAERGVGRMVKERGQHYGAWMPGVKADPTVLDYAPIRTALANAEKMATYQGIVKNPEAAKVLADIRILVHQFEKIPGDQGKTVAGLDALKQAVGDIRMGTKQGTTARKIADTAYNEIKGQITKQAPAYGELMKDYAQASDTIGEMRRTLSLNDKASADTKLRKLQSVMRNDVNTNYGQRQKLVDVLARSEPDLPYALAGQALNTAAPRGLARVAAGAGGVTAVATNPMALMALPAFSPRVVGEAAYATGKAGRALNKAAQMSPLSPEQLGRYLLIGQLMGRTTQDTSE